MEQQVIMTNTIKFSHLNRKASTQLLVSNQKFTGKNQVTDPFCCRPGQFQHLPHTLNAEH